MKCPHCSKLVSPTKDICSSCSGDLRPQKIIQGLEVFHSDISIEELVELYKTNPEVDKTDDWDLSLEIEEPKKEPSSIKNQPTQKAEIPSASSKPTFKADLLASDDDLFLDDEISINDILEIEHPQVSSSKHEEKLKIEDDNDIDQKQTKPKDQLFDAVSALGISLISKKKNQATLDSLESELHKTISEAKKSTEDLATLAENAQTLVPPIITQPPQVESTEEAVTKSDRTINESDIQKAIQILLQEEKIIISAKQKANDTELIEKKSITQKATKTKIAKIKSQTEEESLESAYILKNVLEACEDLVEQTEIKTKLSEDSIEKENSQNIPIKKKVLSHILDLPFYLIFGAIGSTLFIPKDFISTLTDFNLETFFTSPYLYLYILITHCTWMILSIIFGATSIQSPGEKTFKISLVNQDLKPLSWTQSLQRTLLKNTSLCLLGIGFLPIFGKNKEPLHNALSNSQSLSSKWLNKNSDLVKPVKERVFTITEDQISVEERY